MAVDHSFFSRSKSYQSQVIEKRRSLDKKFRLAKSRKIKDKLLLGGKRKKKIKLKGIPKRKLLTFNYAFYPRSKIIIYRRSTIITSKYLGKKVSIYNGCLYANHLISEDMIGIKFGEICFSKHIKKIPIHLNNRLSVKRDKKKRIYLYKAGQKKKRPLTSKTILNSKIKGGAKTKTITKIKN
jgi:ribosomal protein S19